MSLAASPPPAPARARAPWARWSVLAVAIAIGTLAGGAVGLPSAGLFAGMLVGIAYALRGARSVPLKPPGWASTGAEAVVGVTLGAYVQLDTVKAIGSDVVPIGVVSLITLGLTVVAGLALARITDLDAPTASFGMIAGGATGIIVIAERLGADERIVAVLQYLRVLLVMALTPLIAAVVFSGGSGHGGGLGGQGPWLEGLAFCVLSAGIGLALAARVAIPAPALLWPLMIAAALTVGGVFHASAPSLVGQVAFAVIGVRVGLGFTPAALRSAGRALPPALGMMLALLAACGLMALVLAKLTSGTSDFDAYLATTPGGLYAVLAVAVGGGANTTFVLSVQVLRLFVMLIGAPLLARRLAARQSRAAA